MPWSRNYIMFYSQTLVLGLLGAVVLIEKAPRLKSALVVGLVAGIGFQLYLDGTQLTQNALFHENEISFPYDAVADYIAHDPRIPMRSTFYMNALVSIHTSFYRSKLEENNVKALRYEQLFADGEKRWSPRSWIPFEKFKKTLPADAELVFFQWREPRTAVQSSRMWQVPRPKPDELSGFEVLHEFYDPWSAKTTGIMLLKRTKSS